MTDATIIAAVTQDVPASPRHVEVPQALRKLAEGRVKSRTDRARDRALDTIKSYTGYITEATEKMQKAEETTKKEVTEWAETITRLREAGFKPETNDWDLDIVVKTKESRLADLARAIGPLNPNSVEKDIFDAEKKLVTVTIYALHNSRVKVIYLHRLKDSDRCKIVSELVPAELKHKLVCEM